MQARVPLRRAASFPVTVGVALLALAATLFYWSGRDMTPMLMQERAFYAEPWRLLTSALLHGDIFPWAKVWQIGNVAHGVGALAGLVASVAVTGTAPKPRQLPRVAGWLGLAGLLAICLLSATSLRPLLNRDADAGLEVGARAYQALTEARNSEAIVLFERAVKLSPGEPTLWFNLGIAYQREQRLGDARRAYQHAAQLKPGDAMYGETAAMIPEGTK